MKRPFARPLLVGAVLAAGLAGASFAQPAGQPGAGPMQGHHMAGPGPGPGAAMGGRMGHGDPAAMAARHTEHLRTMLQLTPAQEPALKAFVEAMTPAGDMHEQMAARHKEMAGLTTPERLDRMKAHMAERMARFDKHAEATKRFYAQLTPAQKKAFDAMKPMHGHGGMRGKGGGHHMMGGMGDDN
jgi:hypothetical protein